MRLLQLGEKSFGGPAMLEEKEFEAGFFAALAQHFAGAKNFRDAADHRDDLLGLDESVERHS